MVCHEVRKRGRGPSRGRPSGRLVRLQACRPPQTRRFPMDTGMRPVSNACSRAPGGVPDDRGQRSSGKSRVEWPEIFGWNARADSPGTGPTEPVEDNPVPSGREVTACAPSRAIAEPRAGVGSGGRTTSDRDTRQACPHPTR